MVQQYTGNPGPVFDEYAIERLVGSGAEKKARFLRLFLDRSAPLVEQINTGGKIGDLEVIGGAAHQLKSSSASIGGLSLSALAARIEALAHEGGGDALTEALAELSSSYRATCDAIHSTLTTMD